MESQLRTASFLAHLLDNKFVLFGRRFGLNGILGIIPVVGDTVSTMLSFYIVFIGLQMQLPASKIFQMLWNVFVNFGIGLIPIAGDYVDFFHKANLKNVRILEDYAKEHHVIEGEIINSASLR